MKEENIMLQKLKRYYKDHKIYANGFNCPYKEKCKSVCTKGFKFTEAKSAYVGKEYEKDIFPRLLFISLDSGAEYNEAEKRTLEGVRKWEEDIVFQELHRNKHWFLTHELAYKIMKKFKPELGSNIEKIKPFFAHTNSAKCCMNKKDKSQADKILFKNCREFIPGEVRILNPDIIITQGQKACDSINNKFELINKIKTPGIDQKSYILEINNKRVVWIHTYHPHAFGLFWRKNHDHYEDYANLIFNYFNKNN